MRTLVLGGNRYIGRHLVEQLADLGHDVTVLNSHPSPLPDGVRRLHGDRRRPGVLEEVLGPERDDFDVVFDNTSYEVHDVEPLVHLFHGRIQHFVFTSSVAVYRRSYIQPVLESFRRHRPGDTDPRKSYGVHKVECEDLLLSLHERDGFPASIARVTHTIGPHTPLGTREPAFYARLEQRRPILVPAHGHAFVHLVHVDDVARHLITLGTTANAVGRAYNVAGEEFTSVLGCVQLMASVVGVEADVRFVPLATARRQHPPLVHWGEALTGGTVFSITRSLDELEWRPRLGLEAAYRDSYEWFDREGRNQYSFDFARDDAVLAELAR